MWAHLGYMLGSCEIEVGSFVVPIEPKMNRFVFGSFWIHAQFMLDSVGLISVSSGFHFGLIFGLGFMFTSFWITSRSRFMFDALLGLLRVHFGFMFESCLNSLGLIWGSCEAYFGFISG